MSQFYLPIDKAPRDGRAFLAFGVHDAESCRKASQRGVEAGDHWWGIILWDVWREAGFVFAKDGQAAWTEPLYFSPLETPQQFQCSDEERERAEARYRNADRSGDDFEPGTLEQTLSMLERWTPETFPANSKGQVHFARAMMDSTAAAIRAHLANAGRRHNAELLASQAVAEIVLKDGRLSFVMEGGGRVGPFGIPGAVFARLGGV